MHRNLTFLVFLFTLSCASLPAPDFAPAAPCLRLITYNVNWGGANADRILDFLDQCGADVICLQETHSVWESALKAGIGEKYPYSVFTDAGGAGGGGIMSKYPLLSMRTLGPAKAGWFPALLATVDTPFGPAQVLSVHLRPPLSDRGSASLSAYYSAADIHRRELGEYLAATDPERPLIIAGDFNENETGAAIAGLRQRGLTDALSLFDRKSDTWRWRVSFGLTLKNRYDHILFNRFLQCTGARVTHIDASDHFPVFATLVAQTAGRLPR